VITKFWIGGGAVMWTYIHYNTLYGMWQYRLKIVLYLWVLHMSLVTEVNYLYLVWMIVNRNLVTVKIWWSQTRSLWKKSFESHLWTYKWQRGMEDKIQWRVVYTV
jgi:hypothetical protein